VLAIHLLLSSMIDMEWRTLHRDAEIAADVRLDWLYISRANVAA
jgi:hypothetical protein